MEHVLNFHLWSVLINNINIVNEICKHKPTTVNLFSAEEYCFIEEIASELHDLCITNNIRLNYIFGGADLSWYINRYQFPQKNIHVYLWPNFFLLFSRYKLDNTRKEFKYPIMSLNSRARIHRCKFIDMLAKYNLIIGNAISWHDDQVSYDWKYWSPTILEVDTPPTRFYRNDHELPIEWFESFLHVVTETTTDVPFITEKTVKVIATKRLFITYASKNFYQTLTKFGFKLYDEIFDYSFDHIESDDLRLESIIKQVQRVVKLDYNEVYNKIQNKLEYNQQQLSKLRSQKDIPLIVLLNNCSFYNNIFD